MDTVFFIFELIGVISFALSGALVALKSKMDILGVCVLGLTTAIGGGIMRDILLGITPPTSLVNPINACLSLGVAILAFLPFMQNLILSKNKIYDKIFLVADSIGLGLFTVTGINVCFSTFSNPSLFLAIFSGIITAVGGGVLRDVMSKNKPVIFVKHFYACASIIGAVSCAVLYSIAGELIANIVGITLTIVLRFLAAKFLWELPKSKYCETSEKQ